MANKVPNRAPAGRPEKPARRRTAPQKTVVHVFCDRARTVVDPPYVFAKRRSTIEFRLHCDKGEGILFFPRSGMVATTKGEGFAQDPPDRGVSQRLEHGRQTVRISADAAPGVYPYSVYCCHHQDFAVGNSPPEIIIEAP